MKVFVLGGTGAIGGHTVPALVRARHDVTAMARSPEKAAVLRDQGAEPVFVSIFDRDQLRRAFARHDAVVNLASALPSTAQFVRHGAWRDNNRVRTEGSAAVVEAATAVGVPRLIQESVSMLYPDRGSDWIDEDIPPDCFRASQANLAAEANASAFTNRGGNGVVLRFGWFLGPGARHSAQFVTMARWHVAVVLGRRDSYVSSIHIADAANAVVAALTAPPGTYNVVDDEPLTKAAYAAALEDAVGKGAWVRGPGRVALLLGDRLTSLTRSLRVSNGRFRTTTGWSPRYPSAREAWRATAHELGHRN